MKITHNLYKDIKYVKDQADSQNQQIADRATLETVEKHILYVAKQRYKHPVGYFKKAAKDYLKRFI